MKPQIIFIQMICLWCIAVENIAQAPPQSNVEKVRSDNTLVQRYLLPYKQALNNAMDKNDYAAALINLNHILLYEPNNGQALYLRARGFENCMKEPFLIMIMLKEWAIPILSYIIF
jgi:hypothetical protein